MFALPDVHDRLRRLLIVVAGVCGIAGCMPLLSLQPAGDAPHAVNAIWEGGWVAQVLADPWSPQFPSVAVRVRNAPRGELELAWLDQAGGDAQVRREVVTIRHADRVLLASIPYSAFFKSGTWSGSDVLYAWGRIDRMDHDQFVLSVPSAAAFRQRLGGDVRIVHSKDTKQSDVAIMTHVSGETLRHLQAGDIAWDSVVIFRRLAVPHDYPLGVP